MPCRNMESPLRHPNLNELAGQYSSSVFFLFTVFITLYGSTKFISFDKFLHDHGEEEEIGLALACVSISFRIFGTVVLWMIWLAKPGLNGSAPSKVMFNLLSTWLPVLQAAYPLAISTALTFRLIEHLAVGRCDEIGMDGLCNPYYDAKGMSLTLAAELMFNPILVAFLLRDTRREAIFLSWIAAVGVLIAFCAVEKSPDIIAATVGYVFFSILLYCDNERHQRQLAALLAQLRQALVENEQLAEAALALELKAMIGNVAHDLKTPLTSFHSGIECILHIVTTWDASRRPDKPAPFLEKAADNLAAIRKCLHEMKSTTAFMTMSINRCLDYTKANAGVKLVPNMETIRLQCMLDMPIKMMQDMLAYRTIELAPIDSNICSHIITDKQWLLENLLCLLSNALKYSFKGSVDVAVLLIANSAEEPQLQFEVQDCGVGLSEEAMSTLFSPFKQAQRLAGGTGLGLFSLARRVEALHGQYGVSKRPDGEQGSLFWFTIPYRPDQLAEEHDDARKVAFSPVGAPSRVSSPRATQTSDAPASKRYSVLVVDDSPMIVRMTTMLLTRMGHIVKHAGNGAEALDMIIAGYTEDTSKSYEDAGTPPYDVVLMDLQMPIMDGPLAMRRMRAVEEQLRQEECKLRDESSVDDSILNDGIWGSSSKSGPSSALSKSRSGSRPSSGKLGPLGTLEARSDSGEVPEWKEADGAVVDAADGDIEMGFALTLKGPATPVVPELRHRYHQYIVALSANADEETVKDAMAAGADEFMVKPFAYETFAALVDKRFS